MKKIIFLLFLILAVPSLARQNAKFGAKRYAYAGDKINLTQNSFSCQFVSKLQGVKNEGYQGLEVYGDTIISCQNSGWMTFYKYDGKKLTRLVEPFKMACYAKETHANVASLGTEFFAPTDKFPVVYISQCAKQAYKGMKDVLFAERISNDMKSTSTVQTIYYRDENHNFGYALQWVVDRDNNVLYGYGNTINNDDPRNKHRIVKFRIPSLKEGKDGLVILTDKDLLENYLLEDTYAKPFNPIGQGLFVKNGLLFMPTGVGTVKHPSILYVWDLRTHQMHNALDLTKATFSELEDCSLWKNSLLVQAQGNFFRINF